FFQLPPVPDRHDKSSVFAFEAQSWPQCVPRIIKLKQVFRQSNQRFVDMLTEARLGQLSGKSIRGFACLARPIKYEDGINATELFPTKRQSDLANESQLKRLGGETRMFVRSV
ncbi:hypothetical protein HD553DRAFT_275183, partial [Filobasidium floriforme]|uniref:uncharacterized protein n=1 Tax=Filobasidium floriforme TaxID=5210 RepID=UPI001E8E3EC6